MNTPSQARMPDADDMAVLRGSVLGALPETELQSLLGQAMPARFPEGALLNRPGDPLRVALILEGSIRIFFQGDDGRQLSICQLRVGDLAGAVSLASEKNELFADASSELRLLALPVGPVRRALAQFPAFSAAMMADVGRHLSKLVAQMPNLAFQSIEERIIDWYLSRGARGPNSALQITQQRLADELGAARETITRAIKRLRHDGRLRTAAEGLYAAER